jgi:hypothetical protein
MFANESGVKLEKREKMTMEQMLVVVTTGPSTFGNKLLDMDPCVVLAADKNLTEIYLYQRRDMRRYLIENGIEPPPSAGLWVFVCEMKKIEMDDADAVRAKLINPKGFRPKLITWRHPTDEEIHGLLGAQGVDSSKRNKIVPTDGGRWVFLGSLF